ncbi:hypothetical protein SAY87_031843 [Trapa incisa]|uniref:Uncharacterized protein n=2 Tax=Trapa TaxID=22665 RepID=A0AAN7M0V6_TRANT|nr:hypothetical protein SAY87_031843 [Trapa incisa]KAK4796269.1 hypothetical protein SAY86_028595 [Trapa natans]
MVMEDVDEQLAVFLEMQREQEIERDRIHLLQGLMPLSSPMSKTLSMDRRMGGDEFFNLENEKSDLLWLLSPPGTPVIASLKKEAHDRSTSQVLNSVHPTAVTYSAENVQLNHVFKKPTEPEDSSLTCGTKPSANSKKKSSSLGSRCSSTNRRAATPTGRSTTTATATATNKPPRSSSPSRVSTRPYSSANIVGPSAARSSTPTRLTPRSSAPVPKSTSKQSVPNIQPSAQTNTSCKGATRGQARSSSATKYRVTVPRTAVPTNVTPPALDPPSKLSEESSPSTDSKNPKTCLPRRPISASKVRPSSSAVKSFPPIKSRRSSNEKDEVNPILMGTKMVERIVNMRKLAPPKKDAQLGALEENISSRHSSSFESSGFGRSLSKKSLDMAMRHMDITGSIAGTVSRARSGRTKTKNAAVSGITSSSGTSDVTSVNSCSTSIDGSENEDSVLGVSKASPAMVQGR